MADIPNNASTNATLTVGGSFQNSLEFTGDRDWVRIDLAPGQWVAVTQRGTGETPLDAYLSVYDADGNFLTSDDDLSGASNTTDATVIIGGGEGGTFYTRRVQAEEDHTRVRPFHTGAFGKSIGSDLGFRILRRQSLCSLSPKGKSATA